MVLLWEILKLKKNLKLPNQNHYKENPRSLLKTPMTELSSFFLPAEQFGQLHLGIIRSPFLPRLPIIHRSAQQVLAHSL